MNQQRRSRRPRRQSRNDAMIRLGIQEGEEEKAEENQENPNEIQDNDQQPNPNLRMSIEEDGIGNENIQNIQPQQQEVEIQDLVAQLQEAEEEKDQHDDQDQQQPQPQPQNPILRVRPRNEINTQNLAPRRFLAKIPNTKVLRDFFVNHGGYYSPPLRDLTNQFCREVLSGQKLLMLTKDVNWIDQVPTWPEFSVKNLWMKAKQNPQIMKYFPDFSISRHPQRTYLLNIINSVQPNSVIAAVIDIRKKRESQGVEEAPIILTTEFAQLFSRFVSIATDQSRKGLRLSKPKELNQCPLCLRPLSQKDSCNFRCISKFVILEQHHFLGHKSHKICMKNYLESDNGQNSQYLCPMRCSQVQL